MIKTLRTDHGGEFCSHEFQVFCEKRGITRHLTAPYSPQQNGVVERRNRTLLGMTRCILKHMSIPNYLWGEAVRHSTYIINRVGTRVLVSSTPYEMFKKKKPSVGHMRVFGCLGYAKIDSGHLKKLDDRSRKLVHLGTEPGTKAYRLYDPTSRKIVVSRDVVFDENQGWDWKLSEKENGCVPGMFEVTIEGIGNRGISDDDGVFSGDHNNENTEEVWEETHGDSEDTPDHIVLRRSTRETRKPGYLEDYILLAEYDSEQLLMCLNDEPWSYSEAREEKIWRDSCDDEITSIEKNKTWDLVDLPSGAKAIGLKWVFTIKRNSDGSINKFKARLVARDIYKGMGSIMRRCLRQLPVLRPSISF